MMVPDDPCTEQEDSTSNYIWQYFDITNLSEAEKGGDKNAVCKFCHKTFSGSSTSRAAAHILGRPVLGQSNMYCNEQEG